MGCGVSRFPSSQSTPLTENIFHGWISTGNNALLVGCVFLLELVLVPKVLAKLTRVPTHIYVRKKLESRSRTLYMFVQSFRGQGCLARTHSSPDLSVAASPNTSTNFPFSLAACQTTITPSRILPEPLKPQSHIIQNCIRLLGPWWGSGLLLG